ncbi:ATP-binding protein [Streptomyces sp. NBC_00316]|uniref:ATP-binding protein n=1 Tax=Streptomyces sp. NBC_00316 TaxID=2975710 RepID=UPI002E2C27C5|nr:ATP-binding protein [Streptomyces sp. NBC_00316]
MTTSTHALLAELTLPSHPRSAARARHAVGVLVEHDIEAADRVLLLLSEAVANAVEHTCSGHVRVVAAVDEVSGEIFCGVFDTDPCIPTPAQFTEAEGAEPAESGRGLVLIDALSDAWGHVRCRAGKWLWFRVLSEPRTTAGGRSTAPAAARTRTRLCGAA